LHTTTPFPGLAIHPALSDSDSFIPTTFVSFSFVDPSITPKDDLQVVAKQENIEPFAETASTCQTTARQSDCHHCRFNRVANESANAFQQDSKDVEGGYKDAMHLAHLEQEEVRVRRAIEEKERRDREDGKEMMDLDRTPLATEIEDMDREAKELTMQANREASAKRQCRWDISEPTDKNIDPNQPTSSREWSKEALDAATPKKCRSRWDATPADVIPSKTPKRSWWDQTPALAAPDAPMVPIIMSYMGSLRAPNSPPPTPFNILLMILLVGNNCI
jgi:splicing factor 3B subunit 1